MPEVLHAQRQPRKRLRSNGILRILKSALEARATFPEENFSGPIRLAMRKAGPKIASESPTTRGEARGARLFSKEKRAMMPDCGAREAMRELNTPAVAPETDPH